MTMHDQALRLSGVYPQDQNGNLMLRIKIPAGFLTSTQARAIAVLSDQTSNGLLHLTCRGSIELHGLKSAQLDGIFARLEEVGLTTRGACGGAVRGIACSTTYAAGFPVVQAVAHRLNRHFAGNPDFEGLPKKFKISLDAGYSGSRHLIQDLGIVLAGGSDQHPVFDIWCAGGLGREPQAAFLLERAVQANQLIPLAEAVIDLYREHTPPPKRLKFLLNQIGENQFRRLLHSEMARRPPSPPWQGWQATLQPAPMEVLEVPVFAGELAAATLSQLADIATTHGAGALVTTADQNIAVLAACSAEIQQVTRALVESGLRSETSRPAVTFRVCPGNHECRMGLAPTRTIARHIISRISETARARSWAISGCPNSCSQPQLADYGIVTSKRESSNRQPLFDLYLGVTGQLGRRVAARLSEQDLFDTLATLP